MVSDSKLSNLTVSEINTLQIRILTFIMEWAHHNKTPISQRDIINKMFEVKIPDVTTVNALNVLLRKGYLRRASVISNKTFYVLLRTI